MDLLIVPQLGRTLGGRKHKVPANLTRTRTARTFVFGSLSVTEAARYLGPAAAEVPGTRKAFEISSVEDVVVSASCAVVPSLMAFVL